MGRCSMSTSDLSHFRPAVGETQGENRIRDRLIHKSLHSFQIVIDPVAALIATP
jgi:hypothetical protein